MKTSEVPLPFDYSMDDIDFQDDYPILTKAYLRGYGTELSADVLEVINDDAGFQNELEQVLDQEARERAADYADYQYDLYRDRGWA